MTFFPRMLKTLKLLAISPVATVLWFGALGGMVWRLEPDLLNRDGMGSVVGRWVHGPRSLVLITVGPRFTTVECIVGPDGQRHWRTENDYVFGIQESGYAPPLNDFDREDPRQISSVSVDIVGARGFFALTDYVCQITGSEWKPNQPNSMKPLPIETVEAMSQIDQLRELAEIVYPHAKNAQASAAKSLEVEFTRRIWSGYIYNGVMAVLLVVGLHSMRWVYRGVPLRQIRQVWRPSGECGACGYSLAGLNAAKCPECGKELKAPNADQEAAAC